MFVVGLICISSVSAADLSNGASDADVLNIQDEPTYENDKISVVLTATENYGNDNVKEEQSTFVDACGNNFSLDTSKSGEFSSGDEIIGEDIFIGSAADEGD